jgi:hypothetical protein
MACTSLPPEGSLMASAATTSPVAIAGSHFIFCSWLPKSTR